jgi:indolepyruvate ferredoxin oxidoreductase
MDDQPTITLDDKYSLERSRALVGGRQALVRLPIVQRELDRRLGLKTAGYISGYRGSPLGGFDAELWKAADVLAANDIIFDPAVNEDLAMSAILGTQQLDYVPGKTVDGVFGLWYGKGPGVDRSGDAIKHANLLGVSTLGGIVLAFGDDHAGKSSTTAHQSDLTLASWDVPVLYPSSVGEILEMGLAAFALSRFSGLVVGLKLVNETAENTGALSLDEFPVFISPDAPLPPGGVNIRSELRALQEQDARLVRFKLPRARAFARANRLDRIVFGAQSPRLLIVTAGKAYADVIGALELLGIDETLALALGLGVYKVAMIFPLEPEGLKQACASADEIVFIEEKRPHVETQAKEILFHEARRPRISGKFAPDGTTLLPADWTIEAETVALVLSGRLIAMRPDLAKLAPGVLVAQAHIETRRAKPPVAPLAIRRPAFCAGCPHNTSTRVPEGSFGFTGIGCHGMTMFHPDRNPLPMGHMGAEGANWIGLSKFTTTPHVFQNLGDGTYNHSGSLAIRAAVQAKATLTYKILFNDAVAMTGGQPVEGGLTASRIVEQVAAEGVARIVVVSDNPDRFAFDEPLPNGTEVRHRDDLDAVQRELREQTGVTVIVYDQTCAAEKRRRRKIGTYPDPDQRIYINDLVCEGCGDCSVQSNCLAIQPLETEYGRKRKIDQSACNKDFSCVKGFCPSFVTVEGGRPRRSSPADQMPGVALSEPTLPIIGTGFDILVTGVGGTGVLTVSALLGMAARIEDLSVSVFDMTGLSQKGGAVYSHVRLRTDPKATVPAKIGATEANVVLACDLIAATLPEGLGVIGLNKTVVVGNSDTMATADFQLRRDLTVPRADLTERLATVSGHAPFMLPATTLSEKQLGDSIAANLLMLGYAWQKGLIPLARVSIEKAIALNGKAVKANLKAFAAGRAEAEAPASVADGLVTLDDFIARRTTDLRAYWNDTYAQSYVRLVNTVRATSRSIDANEDLAWAVARSAYKLMAYKDEYEVARLYADGRFRDRLNEEFEDVRKLKVHLSPPLISKIDRRTGRPGKMTFGPWIFTAFGVLASLKGLRETAFDIFGRTAERRMERDLRDGYLKAIARLSHDLTPEGLAEALNLASAPLDVRGFGPVKAASAKALLDRLNTLESGIVWL